MTKDHKTRQLILAFTAAAVLSLVAAVTLPWCQMALAGTDVTEIRFRKHMIDEGRAESVAVADVNQDGRPDIISGSKWYEQASATEKRSGPRWIEHHFRDLGFTDSYIEDLSDLAIDINGDGYPDIVSCSYWTKPLSWWENPGKTKQPWREHGMVPKGSPVEFAFLVDILNTGKPLQLLPQFGSEKSPLSWYELAPAGATEPWIKHEVSSKSYGHGIGAGDMNQDRRTDIITPKGWFEAPPDPRNGQWTFHPEFDLGIVGFIYVKDVNGDGMPDLITSMGHDYGIFWYERQIKPDGHPAWVKHVIDDTWSQAHAMTIADLRGDGRFGLLAGKRFHSHPHDPGANEPLGVYWYEPIESHGNLQWVKHFIDYSTRTGGGLQIPVIDIDGDGDLDIVVAGKGGLFLFESMTVSR
jgi:hypothetical protein